MSRVVAITGATGFIGHHLVARHVGDLGGAPNDLLRFARGADVLYHCADDPGGVSGFFVGVLHYDHKL